MNPRPYAARTIFVQIKALPGQAYDVAARIADGIEETSEVYSTSGSYDLLAKFHLGDDQDPGRFVTSRVQTVEGVRETYTILALNAFTPDSAPA
jgi:DNA-binding Lrp family transcriptional regulator